MNPIAILEAGMVTPVGFDAPSSCAAMRVGISAFAETRFMFDGDWLLGAEVPFEEGWRGREKLLRMLIPAVEECLASLERSRWKDVALLLCLAEEGRPGRFTSLDDSVLKDVQARLGVDFHKRSAAFSEGRIGGAKALQRAAELLESGVPRCVLAGMDTLLVGSTLSYFHEHRRLLTSQQHDGFIPGEAAGAVLLGPTTPETDFHCHGIGFGHEPSALDVDRPLKADGLVQAYRAVFEASGLTYAHVDYRITDISGEQIRFKEAALALSRTLRVRKPEFDLWHPSDCTGEIGAAALPIMLGVSLAADRKEYAPGPGLLCHLASDGPERVALILRSRYLEAA